jgi:hypothetical protein
MDVYELHETLNRAFEKLEVDPSAFPSIGIDTAFAIGYAIGVTLKAKALVGRDIDEAIAKAKKGEYAMPNTENIRTALNAAASGMCSRIDKPCHQCRSMVRLLVLEFLDSLPPIDVTSALELRLLVLKGGMDA